MAVKRVAVAMSGGVDSSVALALLKRAGYECVGLSMQLWDYSASDSSGDGAVAAGATGGSCCSIEDVADARRVAERVGAPFYVVNAEERFTADVVEYFVEAYKAGLTPNPCVMCNDRLKFDLLLRKAAEIEADYLATGHYARIEGGRLLKGLDPGKDQSYFLFTMRRSQLGRVLFPLGRLTKREVREEARRLGLAVSEKEESQEICFVEGGDYASFIADRLGGRSPGEIVDVEGKVLGAHKGLYGYTVGQRKGLALSGGPYYVVRIEASSNRVVVGTEADLFTRGVAVDGVNWISPEMREAASGQKRSGGIIAEGVEVKLRYRHAGARSTIRMNEGGSVSVEFAEPQRAAAPGQAAVFYMGEEVLGGGWIRRALK